MYACNCLEWHRSWPKLQNTFMIAWSQDARYDGTAFKNCPWCGEKLRLGFPLTEEETARVNEEETLELPPKKNINSI